MLADLGPVTACFAAHLGSRVDLFSKADRTALLAAPQPPGALDRREMGAALDAALGRSSDFLEQVDPLPESADWAGVWHRARRVDGQAVRLYLLRPGLHRRVHAAFEHLRRLQPLLAGPPWGLPAASLLADFRSFVVEPRLDLERHGDLLDRLAQSGGPLVVPRRVPELCRRNLLGVEEIAGCRGLLNSGPLVTRGPQAAAQLCRVWLWLATAEQLTAHGLHLGHLEDGRPVWLDGTLVEQPPFLNEGLLELLRAAAEQRPERALRAWRQEIPASDLERVRSRLRQVTPRRSGPWRDGTVETGGEGTAEYVLAYWQEVGVQLSTPWRSALGALEVLAHRVLELNPEGDALEGALWHTEWRRGWRWLGEASTPAELASLAERYSAALLELPTHLDRWLEGGDDREKGRTEAASPRAPVLATGLSLLIAMVSVAILVRSFGEIAHLETAGTLLFLVLAAALMRVITR